MNRHRGFTLLEIILAIGIFAGALAIFSEVVRTGLMNSRIAKKQSRAVILCESKLAAILAGIEDASDVSRSSLADAGDPTGKWVYSVATESLNDDDSLVAIRVTVEEDNPKRKRPVTCTLTQWMADMTSTTTSTTDSSSTSSSSSTGTSGSSSSK